MKKRVFLLLLASVTTALCLTGCTPAYRTAQLELRNQGEAYMDGENYEAAIDCFDQALGMSIGKIRDLEVDICYYKAAALINSGRIDEALGVYTALINYNGKNFKPYFLRGCAYMNEAELSPALSDYDRAVELNKNDYQLYIEIYENMAALGFSEEGKKYLNQALELKAKTPEQLTYAGRIYYLLEDYESAKEKLDKASEAGSDDAKIYLAKIYEHYGDEEKAAEILRAYASSEKVTSDALGELGDLEAASGNYEKALNYYDMGLSLEIVDNEGQLLKGKVVALEYLGRFAEAKGVLAEYLEKYPEDEEAAREAVFLATR